MPTGHNSKGELVTSESVVSGDNILVSGQTVFDKVFEREGNGALEDGRLSGEELAGTAVSDEDLVRATVQLFDRIHPNSYVLSEDLNTMNEVMVGIFARMYHLMISKQKDYGPENISKAGLKGIVTRSNDKIERLKVLVGDADKQMENIKAVMKDLPDDANQGEMLNALSAIELIAFPRNAVQGETVEDTLLDLADYGLIGYMLYMEAWGKPLEK
jgi:hypothetical protein